jgi:hypothetical protein
VSSQRLRDWDLRLETDARNEVKGGEQQRIQLSRMRSFCRTGEKANEPRILGLADCSALGVYDQPRRRCPMRFMTRAVAVAAVLALTGMMNADSASSDSSRESRLKGKFAGNTTTLCNYTASPGGTIASNSQSQGVSGTYYFDGAGGLKFEVLSNNFNVPAGTRSTGNVIATGTYEVGADNSVTTEVASDSQTIDGVGTGNTTHIPSIEGRLLMVGDELFRMPAGPPAEETVITTTPTGATTTTFRKCSWIGTLHKIAG